MVTLLARGRLLGTAPLRVEQEGLPPVVGAGDPAALRQLEEAGGSGTVVTAGRRPDGTKLTCLTVGADAPPKGRAVVLILSPGVRARPGAVSLLASAAASGGPVAVLGDLGGKHQPGRALQLVLPQPRWLGLGARWGRSSRRVDTAPALAAVVDDAPALLSLAESAGELATLAIGG